MKEQEGQGVVGVVCEKYLASFSLCSRRSPKKERDISMCVLSVAAIDHNGRERDSK